MPFDVTRRRPLLAFLAASLAAARVARAAPALPAVPQGASQASRKARAAAVGQLRRIHLEYYHGCRQDARRRQLQCDMLTFGDGLKASGMTPLQIRNISHAARVMAKRDFAASRPQPVRGLL